MATRATTSAMMNTLLPMAETEITEKSLILKYAICVMLEFNIFLREFTIPYANQTIIVFSENAAYELKCKTKIDLLMIALKLYY